MTTSSAHPSGAASSELVTEKLSIAGIRCAACVQLIEYSVAQLPGVERFKINPLTQKADLRWYQDQIDLKRVIQAIVRLGYAAFPPNQSLTDYQQKAKKKALWRLFIAGFAMMQIMMYAFPAYLVPVPSADGDLTPDLDRLLKLASLVISLPVIVFSATPFFKGALRDLQHRHIGMDVPVSLGILLTFFASVWATFFGGAVYYDSAVMFVFLLLGARFIEDMVKSRTNAALQILTQLPRSLVQRLKNFPEDRNTIQIDPSTLQVGDVVLVPAGDQMPCDGVVLEGRSECDEALMTGESRPILKQIGDKVIAGSINQHSALIVRSEKVGQETQLAHLIGMMENATLEKPRLVQIADKHASRFLIAIIVIAIVSGIVWSFIEPDRAFWIAISVIVVTCPCALSLATPGVMSAAIGQMAKAGLLVTKGAAIESLAKVTHVVFDKTGTLSFGRLKVLETLWIREQTQARDELQALVLRMSGLSSHPVSKAVHDYCVERLNRSQQQTASSIDLSLTKEFPGLGVEVTYAEQAFRFGRLEFALELSMSSWQIPAQYADKTISVLADQAGLIAIFVLQDSLRDDAVEVVHELQRSGKKVLLLSGDRLEVVRASAEACGINEYFAELKPDQKFNMLKDLQAQGAVVAMVGDGMNDGPALSLANVSIAMGQGAPISQSRSDCLLMSNRLSDLSFAMKVSRFSYRLIQENLAWALLYNVIAIPAAVVGWLEPWHAALGMSLSSLLVVVNGLRVLRMQPAAMLFQATEEGN